MDIIREILEQMKRLEDIRYKTDDRLFDQCEALWKKCNELEKRIAKLERREEHESTD
jgi:hypothetical protein